MIDYERERYQALCDQGPLPIAEHYYSEYADFVRREGVEWVEARVKDWEGYYPETVLRRRGNRK